MEFIPIGVPTEILHTEFLPPAGPYPPFALSNRACVYGIDIKSGSAGLGWEIRLELSNNAINWYPIITAVNSDGVNGDSYRVSKVIIGKFIRANINFGNNIFIITLNAQEASLTESTTP